MLNLLDKHILKFKVTLIYLNLLSSKLRIFMLLLYNYTVELL